LKKFPLTKKFRDISELQNELTNLIRSGETEFNAKWKLLTNEKCRKNSSKDVKAMLEDWRKAMAEEDRILLRQFIATPERHKDKELNITFDYKEGSFTELEEGKCNVFDFQFGYTSRGHINIIEPFSTTIDIYAQNEISDQLTSKPNKSRIIARVRTLRSSKRYYIYNLKGKVSSSEFLNGLLIIRLLDYDPDICQQNKQVDSK
jgi:hypothetical protein